MAITWLPCGTDENNSPDVTYNIELEGEVYDIRYRYLQRQTNIAFNKNRYLNDQQPILADEWKIYISKTGEDPIVETSLKTNRDLLAPYYYREGCPQGVLQLTDTLADSTFANGGSYSPERATFDELGVDKRFRVMYIPSTDFT